MSEIHVVLRGEEAYAKTTNKAFYKPVLSIVVQHVNIVIVMDCRRSTYLLPPLVHVRIPA